MQYSSDGAVEDADVVLNNDRLKQVATELWYLLNRGVHGSTVVMNQKMGETEVLTCKFS